MSELAEKIESDTRLPFTFARRHGVLIRGIEGGVADCGKAQNCVEVCPKEIPLVDSIASVARDTTKRMLFGWLLK